VLPYRPMFGKILLTAAVILGAYLVIRARTRHTREPATAPRLRSRAPLVPAGTSKVLAYGLLALMVAGSLLWMYLDYEAGREVVTVRVINSNTGKVTTYRARQAEVNGRGFTTLDGRPITLADVDRMELRAER
jgi:uncharacterized iron-regulated membrane protein